MPRFTLVLLPPAKIAEQIEDFARHPYFDTYMRDKKGNQLYRLGYDAKTGEYRNAHATSVQVECSFDDFIRAKLFIEEWHRKHDCNTLKATLTGFEVLPVPAGTKGYEPVLDHDAAWVDLNIARRGNVLNINEAFLDFLLTLPSVEKVVDPDSGKTVPKTINGTGKYGIRPHFTLGKAVLPEDKGGLDIPAWNHIPKSFQLYPAIGPSKLTGELVDVWYIFKDGEWQDVNPPEELHEPSETSEPSFIAHAFAKLQQQAGDLLNAIDTDIKPAVQERADQVWAKLKM